ncbi:MAG: sigma-70 family RNA polymerase sigma factor [Tannerellaceae bacterium]|jgi:RNA polymerase sigma-70 factor (ECF subfamily)|nr:sigma-70 family RNA polymerase sigma factor [Tannerellaceae bacterium]
MLSGKKDIAKLTDEELLSQFKKTGNADCFGELYSRYIPLIFGVCLKYLKDADKAQDAVMQLFEDLFTKVNSYEIIVFKTWLHTVVRNHCLQIFRKENKEIRIDYDVNLMESDEFLHLLTEEENESEEIHRLKNCMEKLPEPQRISISYFFFDEMSYADIVEKTGYALSKVKSFIQNGKRNLKICIERNRK